MMTFSYTRPRTIDLVLHELCQHSVGTLIETSVRDLAARVGRSAGQMSDHLDQLARDGWIRRLAVSEGTIVEVLRSDQGHDRSFTAPESDHVDDPLPLGDHPTPTPNPLNAGSAPEQTSDHADDPPLHPPIRYKHESHEQQQHGARVSFRSYPVYRKLREAGAVESVAEQIINANPRLTIAEFEAMRRAAKRRAAHQTEDAIGLVFWCLQRGQKLYSPKEPNHERSREGAQGAARDHQRHAADRRAAPVRRSDQPSDADIERLRASFAAAPPLCIDVQLPELRHERPGADHL